MKSTRIAIAALLLATSVVGTFASSATAAEPVCKNPWVWSNKAGDTWRFESCNGTVVVIRDGGPLGYCSKKYPDGSMYTGPESDCAYNGPH